jgi:uncharacterized protein YjbI with pentapeptide repeats
MQNDSEDDISQLRTENAALKAELEESRKAIEALEAKANIYERIIDVEKALFKRTSRFGLSIFLGSSLEKSIKAWLQAVKPDNLLPIEETANVAAAVIRRMLGNRFLILLGSLVGFTTVFLLIWQNSLIQRQINQQGEQTNIARRAQLISILYDRDCSLLPFQQSTEDTENNNRTMEDCPPKADVRSRTEAITAFVEIEKSNGVESPNLSYALLQDTSLWENNLTGEDLTFVNFYFADLRNAKLGNVDLRGADLGYANLSNAFLIVADLRNAKLGNVDLRGAILRDTFLTGLDLRNADLSNANLRGAIFGVGGANLPSTNLRGTNLRGAYLNDATFTKVVFDNQTIWPEGFEPPTPAINCSNEPDNQACVYWEEKEAEKQ